MPEIVLNFATCLIVLFYTNRRTLNWLLQLHLWIWVHVHLEDAGKWHQLVFPPREISSELGVRPHWKVASRNRKSASIYHPASQKCNKPIFYNDLQSVGQAKTGTFLQPRIISPIVKIGSPSGHISTVVGISTLTRRRINVKILTTVEISTLFRRPSKYSFVFQRFFDDDSTLKQRRKCPGVGVVITDEMRYFKGCSYKTYNIIPRLKL